MRSGTFFCGRLVIRIVFLLVFISISVASQQYLIAQHAVRGTLILSGKRVTNNTDSQVEYFFTTNVDAFGQLRYTNNSGAIVQATPLIKVLKLVPFTEKVRVADENNRVIERVITGLRPELVATKKGESRLVASSEVENTFSVKETFSLESGTYWMQCGMDINKIDGAGNPVGDAQFFNSVTRMFIMVPAPKISDGSGNNDSDQINN